MSEAPHQPGRRRRVAVDAAAGFIIVLLVVQMWLLTATLESSLAGHDDVALPAFIASALLLLAGVAVDVFIRRLDRQTDIDESGRGGGPWLIR
jgi:hypothetical protein